MKRLNYRESSQPYLTTKKKYKNKEQQSLQSSPLIPIRLYLGSDKKVLNIEVEILTTFAQLKVILKKTIFQKNKCKNKIIGFQTIQNDYCLDYQLQIGEGKVTKQMNLKCLFEEYKYQGIQKYTICKCLAVGGFSKVFLVRSKIDGEFYAAKFIEKYKNKAQQRKYLIENQKEVGSKLNHPFIVKNVQFIQTTQFFVLIMEYCPGGELFYMLKKRRCLNQQQAKFCFIEILLGLEQIHNNQYMFRDLKPENIILDRQGHLKITDFGLVKSCKTKSYSFCGSLQYMAPEIILCIGHNKNIDFYCLGALLYQMLIGHPPFYSHGSSPIETKSRILQDSIQFPQQPQISEQTKDIIRKLLIKNEKFRLGSLGGSKEILCHPWIGKISRKKYLNRQISSPFKVNLCMENFDPDQIGKSQRAFANKIEKQLKNIRKVRSLKKSLTKQKKKLSYRLSTMHNNENNNSNNRSFKIINSPYYARKSLECNKSINPYKPYLISTSTNKNKSLKKLYRIIKTQTIQQTNPHNKYMNKICNTTTQTHKQNINSTQIKIKKKNKNTHKNSKNLFSKFLL